MNKLWKTYSSDIPSNASRVCSRYKVGADGRLQTVAGIGTEVVKVFNPTEGVRFIDAATANPLIDSKGILFSPKAISGLQLWLDAADASTVFNAESGGSTPADGEAIGRWQDKSDNANHAVQGTVSNRPLYQLADINGRNSINFDGINDFFGLSSNIIATDYHTFSVAFKKTTDVIVVPYGNSSIWSHVNNNSEGLTYLADPNNFYTSSTGHITALSIIETKRASNVSRIVISGTEYPTNNTLITDINVNNIGRVTTNYTNGFIVEVCIYNRQLTTDEASNIRAYLANKWGITLP